MMTGRNGWVLGLFMVAGLAEASHPMPPVQLKQEVACGQTTCSAIAAGAWVGPTDVRLTASSASGTCDSTALNYSLEFEIRPLSTPFSGAPTHTSAWMAKPSCVVKEYPYTVISGLASDTFHWQGRGHSPDGVGSWVQFAGGGAAFIVGNPAIPELTVTSVGLSNLSTSSTTLEFDVNASFRNLGQQPATDFLWKAWLSTDKGLDASDTLIHTSVSPLSVPATSDVSVSQRIIVSPKPASGEFYVLVEADATGLVAENSETNNVGSTTTSFTAGVELIAQSISGPARASNGAVVSVNVAYVNLGTDSVSNLQYKIWLSTDAVLGTGDQAIFTGTTTLAAGQQVTNAVSFTLPNNTRGGNYYYLLQLDSAAASVEIREDNNIVTSAAQVKIDTPDLVLESAQFVDVVSGLETQMGFLGQNGRFKVKLSNQGAARANDFHVGIVISYDSTLSRLNDTFVYDHPVTQLAIGQTVELDFEFPIPLRDKANKQYNTGVYYLFAVLDSLNELGEVSDSNNVSIPGVSGPPPVTLKRPAQDYTAAWVDASTSGAAGEILAVTRTLRNVGTEAGQEMHYRYYASANNIISTGDVALDLLDSSGNTIPYGTLTLSARGEDVATEWVRLPPSLSPGTYYIGVITDHDERLAELEESNNAQASVFPTTVVNTASRLMASLPDGVVGFNYVGQVALQGAAGSVTYAIDASTGALPEGLTLASDGRLTGIPTTVGFFAFTVNATYEGRVVSTRQGIRVLPLSSELQITTKALPVVLNRGGTMYSQRLGASGGVMPYRWSLVSGEMPPGIVLQDDGSVSGALKSAQTTTQFPLVLEVRDATGQVATAALALRLVSPAGIYIETDTVPLGVRNEQYGTSISARNVDGSALAKPLSWTLVGGSLPSGIELSVSDEEIANLSGVPTSVGTFGFSVQVEDSRGRSDVLEYWLSVQGSPLQVTAEAWPTSVYWGQEVKLRLLAGSATGNVRFRRVNGVLPTGLSIQDNGEIVGTVDANKTPVGTYSFVVEARDSGGNTGLGAFTLEVVATQPKTGCQSVPSSDVVWALGLVLTRMAMRRRKVTGK